MKRLYEPAAYDTSTPVGSYWETFADPALRQPALVGDHETEVAIIGAGFTGLNAALQLVEEHGLQATVLEAGQIGWGASGRNGGFACMGGSKMGLKDQVARFGEAETQKHFDYQRAAIARVADNLERYGIDADTHSDGELYLAHRPKIYAELVEDAREMQTRFGVGFEAVSPEAQAGIGADGPEFFGGIREVDGFALNPMKYVQGLGRAALKAGVTVHGDTSVEAVRREGGGFRLVTASGSLKARKLIVATNGYTSDDIPDAMAGRAMPVMSSIILTRPITPDEQAAQGWTTSLMAYDARNLLHYFRLLPDGRFLFGLRGATSYTPSALAGARTHALKDFRRMFPAWAAVDIDHFWSGFVCLTRDLHAMVAPLPDLDGAFAAFGFHGNGVAAGSAAGRAVADLVAGRDPGLPAILRADSGRFPLPGLRRWYLRGAFAMRWLDDTLL